MPKRNGLKTIAFMTCLAMALYLPGCAFSQWTEHYYFGDYAHKPVYRDRVATGVAIMPFALVGDVVTSPLQLLLLVFKGDDFLYRKSSVVNRDFFTTRENSSSTGLAELTPNQRSEVEATVASQIDGLDGSSQTVAAVGVMTDGTVRQVALSPEEMEQLKERVDPGNIQPGLSCSL
jgi:hypothetical protein